MAILVGKEIKVLDSGTVVNAFSPGATAIYTAPASNKIVLTRVAVRCTAATAVATPATVKIEINPAAGDVFAAESMVGVLDVDDVWIFSAEARSIVVPAGATVDLTVTIAATGTSQSLEAEVIGYVVF